MAGGADSASGTCGCFLRLDLLAKLWLRERQLSRVYEEHKPCGNRKGRGLHIIMLMRSPCWKAKNQRNPQRGLKMLSPSGQEERRSKLLGERRWAGSGASVRMARRLARLRLARHPGVRWACPPETPPRSHPVSPPGSSDPGCRPARSPATRA